MKRTFLCAALVMITAGIFSCNRDDNKSTAGKGGNATLSVVPKHHDVFKNLINCKVFIKYNASDAPSFYDDSVSTVQISDEPTAVFTGLKTGKYYLYGTGFDTSIKQGVSGGAPYTISSETALEVDLAVTE